SRRADQCRERRYPSCWARRRQAGACPRTGHRRAGASPQPASSAKIVSRGDPSEFPSQQAFLVNQSVLSESAANASAGTPLGISHPNRSCNKRERTNLTSKGEPRGNNRQTANCTSVRTDRNHPEHAAAGDLQQGARQTQAATVAQP